MNTRECRSESREHLGFAEAVVKYIEPVLTALGFHRTDASCYAVKYGSPNVLLEVVHDAISYGIGIEFRRAGNSSDRCSLGGLLASVGKEGGFQASTSQRVETTIMAIADLLRRYGMEVLAGDPETYRRLAREAQARSEAYTKEVVQQPVRHAAETAWQKHDYAKVRDLYEPMEADLTPVEKKRLDYARSHSPSR